MFFRQVKIIFGRNDIWSDVYERAETRRDN